MTDTGRRRLRVILLLTFVPFALAGLILSMKLFGLSPTAQRVMNSYDAGAYARSVDSADALFEWNAFQPWIAHFDRGTALAADGFYNEAVDDLERAFDLAPQAKRCDVAVNLSLSWERLGDSYVVQGLYAGAQRLYDAARAVIAAAGEECEPSEAPFNEEEGRNPGEELADAAERLEQKSDQAGRGQEQTRGEQPTEDLGDQLDQLDDRQNDAAREKAEQQGRERGQNSQGGFTDRPW